MATHSSTLAWQTSWMEEPGRLQSMGSLGVRHDWATSLFTFMHWRRKWQPTPVFLPGESQGRGSLVGCRLWVARVRHDWSDLPATAAAFLDCLGVDITTVTQMSGDSMTPGVFSDLSCYCQFLTFSALEKVLVFLFCSVQSLSRVWLFVTPCMPGLPVYHQLLEFTKFMSIQSVMPSNHLTLCCPLLLLPSIFPSVRVFSNDSALCIRWPKYWSFSFSISLSNEHPGLISFRMDWLDLLAVQGTLKSLLQHHSSKVSILLCSAFFIVQLSYDYWKNHSLD